MNENDLWSEVLNKISTKISTPSFETWIKKTNGYIKDGSCIVIAENEFQRDWLETRYTKLFEKVLEEATGKTFEVLIDVTPNGVDKNDNRSPSFLQRIELLEKNVSKLMDVNNSDEPPLVIINGIEVKKEHSDIVKKRILGEISLEEFLKQVSVIK